MIEPTNGDAAAREGPLGLRDRIVVETPEGEKLEFEVVGIVEDEEHHEYGVCYSETADDYIVTDASGALLADAGLAQEILDDFLVFAEESAEEE